MASYRDRVKNRVGNVEEKKVDFRAPTEEEVLEYFKKHKDVYVKNGKEITEEEVETFLEEKKEGLGHTLINMAKKTISVYKSLPIEKKIMVGAALAYVLSPVDLVLDIVPLMGFLDDALLLASIYKFADIDSIAVKEESNVQMNSFQDAPVVKQERVEKERTTTTLFGQTVGEGAPMGFV